MPEPIPGRPVGDAADGRSRHRTAAAPPGGRHRSVRARRCYGALALVAGGMLLLPLIVPGSASAARAPYDAGLKSAVKLPAAPSGRQLLVTSYGATPDDDANDDSEGFRKAIAAAGPGDEVVVPVGTYVFTRRKVELKTGVSVRGASPTGAVIAARFSSVPDNNGSYLFGAASGVNNLSVSDLRLTSSGGQALNYPVYLGSESARTNVSRIAVRGLQIDGFHKMAVSIRNGDNITVENNVIRDALSLGEGGEGYGVMIGYSRSTNNRIADNTIGPVMRHGILLQYKAHHNLVEGNEVRGTVYDAYDLHGEDEYSNELRDNLARDCGEGGFGIGNTGGTPEHYNAGPKNWIHHNEVRNCKWGIHIYRRSDTQYVEDNYFHDNSSTGMLIHDEGARNVVFARNRSQHNGEGVRLTRAPGVKLIGNVVTDNEGYGLITDSKTTGYEIRDNDFRRNGDGVRLGSRSGTASGNQQA